MNFLQKLLLMSMFITALPLKAADKENFLKKRFTTATGYQLNYRVLYPKDFDANKKYPLLLFLHGMGERGNDNESQLIHGGDFFSSLTTRINYPCILIAPQCPEDDTWLAYQLPTGNEERKFNENPKQTPSSSAVKELLDSYVARGSIDQNRIYVTGLSMGGMGTFDLVLRYPNYFAAAAPICGAMNRLRLEKYKGNTSFYIYHGSADPVVDCQYSRDAYEILKKHGKKVYYKEYPNVQHNSWDNVFKEPSYLKNLFDEEKK